MAPGETNLALELPAAAEHLPEIREHTRSIAREAGLPRRAADELTVAVSEAAGLTLTDEGLGGVLRVEFGLRPDRVRVIVRREAGRSGVLVPFAAPDRTLALRLVQRLADYWQIANDPQGVCITVEKQRAS